MSTEAPAAPPSTPASPAVIPPGDKSSSPVPSIEHNSPAEIESRVQEALKAREAMADFFDTGKRKKAEPKVDEKPAEDPAEDPEPEEKPAKPEKKAKAEPEKGAEEKPKKPRKQRVDPEDEDDDVVDRIEKGFDKVAKKLEKQAPKEEKADPNGLSKRDADKLRVFEEMAKEKGDEYGDLPAQFKSFVAKEAKYKAAWEKKNPGETFNPDDHEEFYDQNSPQYEDDDYVDARAELKASEAFERKQKAFEEKMAKREREGNIEKTAKEATADVADALATAMKGEKTSMKSLSSEDPVESEYAKEVQGELETLVGELYKVFGPGDRKPFNEENATHKGLEKRLFHYEGELLQLDPNETMMGDRQFTTLARFGKMSPDQKERHWTIFLEPDLVKHYMVHEYSDKVKAKISAHEGAWSQRVSKNGGQSNGKTPVKSPDSKPAESKPSAKKTPAPSVSGGDRTATPIAPAKAVDSNPLAAMANFFG